MVVKKGSLVHPGSGPGRSSLTCGDGCLIYAANGLAAGVLIPLLDDVGLGQLGAAVQGTAIITDHRYYP